MAQQHLYKLRESDNCEKHGPFCKSHSSVVAVDTMDSNALCWEWEFKRKDTDGGKLLTHLTTSSSRFLKLGEVYGLIPGGWYDVRIRPIYIDKESYFGPTSCLSIASCCMFVPSENDTLFSFVDFNTGMISMFNKIVTNDTLLFVAEGLPAGQMKISIFNTIPPSETSHSMEFEYRGDSLIHFPISLERGLYNYKITINDELYSGVFVVTKD
jgi:hypothetical protein